MNAIISLPIILALLGCICEAEIKLFSEDPETLKTHWKSFKKSHGKKYDNANDDDARFGVFVENMIEVDQRNSLEQASIHGITKFSDMTDAEFQAKYLGLNSNKKSKDKKGKSLAEMSDFVIESTMDLPPVRLAALVDWSSGSRILTTPVKDQGYCGSCWAFAAVVQIESDAMRTLGYTFSSTSYTGTSGDFLSAEQIVQCDTGNYGCDGGWTDVAMNYVKNAGGLVTDADYPYTSGAQGVTGTCGAVAASKKKLTVTTVYTVKGEIPMAAFVQSTGPLAIYVCAKLWNSYSGGIMTNCGCATTPCTANDLTHAVQAVGVDTSSGGYWKVRNQWGTGWGESGYIRLSYGANTCGIASDNAFYAAVARVSTTPVAATTTKPTSKPPTRSPTPPTSKSPTATPISKAPTKTPTFKPSVNSLSPAYTVVPTRKPTVAPSLRTPTAKPSTPSRLPSSAPVVPSRAPSVSTRTPTTIYSLNPTASYVSCPAYKASNTDSAQMNTVPCYFSACSGTTVSISSCSSAACSGGGSDQYIRLYDASNILIAYDDDSCILCSQISFQPLFGSALGTCQVYRLEQGCYADKDCSGEFQITNAVYIPVAPSMAPAVLLTPTIAPSSSIISAFSCAAYSFSSSGSTGTCTFYACPGQTVSISGCSADGGSCSGDTVVTLQDSYGNRIAKNDDYCGLGGFCSKIDSYLTSGACQTYTIKERCYSGACSGTYRVSGASSAAVVSGTTVPSTRPTSVPTQLSLTRNPTVVRVPSRPPTRVPTLYNGGIIKTCTPYSNYGYCTFTVNADLYLTIQSTACTGDQSITLYDSSGNYIEDNDDQCDTNTTTCRCSKISRLFLDSAYFGSGPLTLYLQEECYDAAYSCSGTFVVSASAY